MADRTPTGTRSQRAFEILDFERPIAELEVKIAELEVLSKSTHLDLNGDIGPLRERLRELVSDVFLRLSPWQEVQVARLPSRPLATDYLAGICDEWMEFHGDRFFKDDPAILTAFGRIGARRILLVAHRKGRDTKEKIQCHFGCAHPEGYRKALRRMRLAEKLGIPIVTFINTPGAYPGIGAEERGQAWAIAENLEAMFTLRVPIVCVVLGEGGSGGALGIGVGDRILMLQHSYYSVISPEGCAAILWSDAKKAPEAAAALRLSSSDLRALGVIDEVLAEPAGAAHRDPASTIALVKERILHHLSELERLPVDALLDGRYAKYRAMGTEFIQPPAIPEVAPDPLTEPTA
jgi:acetyl-CoA carboxylase carboxyl transferase subunit alpha